MKKRKVSFVCSGRAKKRKFDEKLRRLTTIVSRLSEGETLIAAELAEQFRTSKRTILRDMDFLSEIDWPVYSYNGGWKFSEEFSMRKIVVTPEEKFLMTLFYRLFSQSKQPFSVTAKNLFDKVVVASDQSNPLLDEISAKYKRNVLKEEFTNFSDSLAVRLEDCSYPKSFIEKIDAYLAEVKKKIDALRSKDRVNIKIKLMRKYENNKPVAIISVPKTYFKDNTLKHDFSTHIKEREFLITTALPGKFHKSFRISLELTMFFDFWGTHFKSRDITCFDEFAQYIGFGENDKILNYKCSYGAYRKSHQLLITEASLLWQKEIPMPAEEIKPFLHKKSGIPWSKSWDARKKVWKTKR